MESNYSITDNKVEIDLSDPPTNFYSDEEYKINEVVVKTTIDELAEYMKKPEISGKRLLDSISNITDSSNIILDPKVDENGRQYISITLRCYVD